MFSVVQEKEKLRCCHSLDKVLLVNLTSVFYFVSSINRVLLTVVHVTQFDLALIHVFVTGSATVFTIRRSTQ